jgi:3'-phosphoadenosine 5'-phosphosulfate sulfotransferase (PAPS reductase)/FAD synthetase
MYDEVDFYLEDLKSKFNKIDPNEYFLSYSGGRDSHLLYWFLKTWLPKNDFKMWLRYKNISIVAVNTRMEHPEILRRMIDLSDKVLLPELKPFEIKEKYGSPCFSKMQDEMISRYNKGNRSKATMQYINGSKNGGYTMFKLNNKAKGLLLSGELHNVSPRCCDYLKKKPMKKYQKETNLKPILGVRASESLLRKAQYKSCFTKDEKFTPLFDLDDILFEMIYKKFKIETPHIYKSVSQTGCMGCPYGSHYGNTKIEIDLLPKNKRNYIIKYFKESYDVLGIEYQTRQLNLFDKE